MKAVTRKRAAGMRFYERELRVGGGLPAGAARLKMLNDNALRVMAHAIFERSMQMSDPFHENDAFLFEENACLDLAKCM